MVGHFDTVYAAGTTRERPFRVEGPLAYGPGTVDMKGGLVIAIFALEALQEAGVAMPPVTLIMNGDEEPGSPRSRGAILREAPGHDLALILEPGRPGPALTIARNGVGIFRMTVSGVEAHAGSEPEKGANAIVEAAHKAAALYALNDFAVGTTVNPGVIGGGTKPYVVPGSCELVTDIRVPKLSEQARVLEALDRITHEVHVPGTSTELAGGFHRPPMEPTERTHEYVCLLRSVARSVGYPLGTTSSGGASDGNLTASAGVPTIDGMGAQGGRSHSPEEYIEIESLTRKGAVLAGFLASLADPQLRAFLEM
jgi:glutamate carboxypeptidase